MKRLRIEWMNEVDKQIDRYKLFGEHFNYTLSWIVAKRFLINKLLEKDIPYKIVNCGAGVSCITTNTYVCPLCKGKL
jgi:hypothetical protein